MDVRPLVPGEYAKPTRGPQLFLAACGAMKSIRPRNARGLVKDCDFA